MTGRDLYSKLIFVFDFLYFLFRIFPLSVKQFLYSSTFLFRGKFGAGMRYVLVKAMVKELGRASYFAANTVMRNPGNIVIGSNLSLHDFCYLDGYGGIKLGDNISIAHAVSLISFEHTWGDPSKPIKYNKVKGAEIVIDDDVWIGCGVRILAGAHIESRVVVAAGAVVKGRLDSGWVYGGVPAKKLRAL